MSGTTAETVDMMITHLKETGRQNTCAYYYASRRVIAVFDNNEDNDQKMPFEEYEKLTKFMPGSRDERKINGQYDWWLTF